MCVCSRADIASALRVNVNVNGMGLALHVNGLCAQVWDFATGEKYKDVPQDNYSKSMVRVLALVLVLTITLALVITPARPGPAQSVPRPVSGLNFSGFILEYSIVQCTLLYSYMWLRLRPQLHPTRPDPTHTTRRGPHEHDHQRIDVLSAASPPPPPTCAALLHSRPLRPVQSSPLTCHWMNE